jgi:hypothetical protein
MHRLYSIQYVRRKTAEGRVWYSGYNRQYNTAIDKVQMLRIEQHAR